MQKGCNTSLMHVLILIMFGLTGAGTAFAQAVEVREETMTTPAGGGREKAAGYFRDRKAEKALTATGATTPGATPRFLAIHAGTFFTDQSYKWGKGDQSDLGKLDIGVDYRLGEWINAADFMLRVDFTGFELDEGAARKLSIQGMIAFPDANSRFPLYFGASLGPGFFIKQIKKESVLSLDYGLFAGARVLDVVQKIGFMAEIGLKDHVFLLSDGQFNGFYFNLGCAFAF